MKLWQFKEGDRERIVRLPSDGVAGDLRPGVVSSRILFEGADEHVVVEEWEGSGRASRTAQCAGARELLVLAGAFTDGAETMDRWTWPRLPASQSLRARVGSEGARVWYKLAPLLLHADVCAFDSGEVRN